MSEEEEILVPMPPSPPPRKKVLGMVAVPDVGQWRRWWSLRWMAVSGLLQIAAQSAETLIAPARAGWSLIPAEWTTAVPQWVPQCLGWAAIAALAAAGLSRLVQQQVKK